MLSYRLTIGNNPLSHLVPSYLASTTQTYSTYIAIHIHADANVD